MKPEIRYQTTYLHEVNPLDHELPKPSQAESWLDGEHFIYRGGVYFVNPNLTTELVGFDDEVL